MFMVMAAAKYPEEAAKVRVQLDAVIGYNRRMVVFLILVKIIDFPFLQYLRSTMWTHFREFEPSFGRYSVGGMGL